MIASGSNLPGIDWTAFQVPPGTSIRYDRPAAALRGYFPCYAVLDSDPDVYSREPNWLLPSAAKIWIVLTEAPIVAQIRNRRYSPLGAAVLYGSTSRAGPVTPTAGGVSIVVDVGPSAWGRWFDGNAESYRDQVTPLDELWPAESVTNLLELLHASDRAAEVPSIIDSFLLGRSSAPPASEDLIRRTAAVLAEESSVDVSGVADAVGISTQTLLRLCRRHFGFGPKLLMRRRRFLRALTEMLMKNVLPSEAALNGYHDVPHFVREGKDLLGMTPRQFLSMPQPYLRAALRARAAIIGSSWSVLDN